MKRKLNRKAFTLVELLVVIAILAILATVSVVGYTAFIKNAYVSNDNTLAAELSNVLQLHLREHEINDEDDLKEALALFYEGDFVPQSAQYGYHFIYDYKAEKVVLERDPNYTGSTFSRLFGLNTASADGSACNHKDKNVDYLCDDCGEKVFGLNSPRAFADGKYLLDQGGSAMVEFILELENNKDLDDITVPAGIEWENEIKAKLGTILIHNNKGVHTLADTSTKEGRDKVVGAHYPADAKNLAANTITGKFENLPSTVEVPTDAVVKNDTLTYLVKDTEVILPVERPLVEDDTLTTQQQINNLNVGENVKADESVTISITVTTNDGYSISIDLSTVLDENDGVKTFNADVKLGSTEVKVEVEIKAAFTNPLVDFGFTCDSVEAGVLAFGEAEDGSYNLYIHYNKLDSFKLIPGDWQGETSNDNIYGVGKTAFKVSGSSVLSVAEDGTIQITGYPTVEDCSATITATCGNIVKTINVTIVRPTNATISFNGTNLTMTAGVQNTIALSFVGKNTFEFGTPSVDDNSKGTGIVISADDKKMTITAGTGDVFHIENNTKLVLDKYSGTQDLTITIGGMSKTFTVTVTDEAGSPFDIKWDTDEDAGIKFVTGEDDVKNLAFLYRVGNNNAIKLSTLFNNVRHYDGNATLTIYDASQTYTENGTVKFKEINSSNDNLNASYNDAKSFSVSEWSNKTFTFSGTGVAIIEIKFNNSTVRLAVEVVDGYNVYDFDGLFDAEEGTAYTNVVLQDDIKMTSNGDYTLKGTFYGNGYTFDITDGKNHYTSGGRNGIIHLNAGSHMDNVVVIGSKFPSVCDAQKNQYYVAAIGLEGGTLTNSYIYGCQAAVRSTGGKIINTVLDGGTYANLICKGGTTTIEDITTINQPIDSSCGLGIYVSSGATLNISGTLTQHNWGNSTESKYFVDDAKTLYNIIFEVNEIKFTYNNQSWVNTGIFVESTTAKVTGNIPSHYIGVEKSYTNPLNGEKLTGYAYSFNNSAYTFTGRVIPNAYAPVTQGAYAPKLEWTYPTGYDSKTNTITIKLDEGTTTTLNPNFLIASKYGNILQVNVKVDAQDYTGNTITINGTEDYTFTLTYSYTDPYVYDKVGGKVATPINYTQTVEVSVQIIKKVGAPTFNFHYGTAGSASAGTPHVTQPTTTVAGTVVTAGTDKYIMPNVSAVQDGKIGSTTVNGVTIYYPIVDGINVRSGSSTDYDFLRYYPIFKGVTITDDTRSFGYTSTKEMPTYFTWVSATISGNSSGGLATDSETKAPLYTLYDNKYISRYQTQKGNTEDGDNSLVKFSYQAVDGNTYYYYIGYKFYNEDEGSACVTGDTLVTLANGTQKEIQYVTAEDILLVWNHFSGKYDTVPAAIIFNHGYDFNTVIKLNFSDGTQVKMINLHQFFDADLNKYVSIDPATVQDYVGHNFVKQDGVSYTTVTLESYEISEEYIEAYGIISALHYNFLVEGMFSTDFKYVDYDIFNYFTMGEDMMFDAEMMQSDIETYGLYTYEDFADYLTYEQFVGFNVQYFKIAVGKGLYTYEGILKLIAQYLNK